MPTIAQKSHTTKVMVHKSLDLSKFPPTASQNLMQRQRSSSTQSAWVSHREDGKCGSLTCSQDSTSSALTLASVAPS